MKVCHITRSCSRSAGGLFESVRGMVRAQLEHGMDVEVTCLNDQHLDEDILAWPNDVVSRFKNVGETGYGFSSELISHLKASNADVFHLHGIWNFAATACLFALRNRPLVISPRGMLDKWILSRGTAKKRISAFFVERPLIRRAVVHALNDSELISVQSFCPTTVCLVSPNAVTIPTQTIQHSSNSQAPFRFCFLGRIHPKKGLTELIHAISHLNTLTHRRFILNIYGWGDENYIQEIISLTKTLKLSTQIFFNGPVQGVEKANAFLCSNAFILPSYSEGLPMAVLEAASYGLPCVLTKECNLPEFFTANAAIRSTQEPESIAQGMLMLLNSNDIKELSSNALSVVSNKFSWNAVYPQILGVYQKAIAL